MHNTKCIICWQKEKKKYQWSNHLLNPLHFLIWSVCTIRFRYCSRLRSGDTNISLSSLLPTLICSHLRLQRDWSHCGRNQCAHVRGQTHFKSQCYCVSLCCVWGEDYIWRGSVCWGALECFSCCYELICEIELCSHTTAPAAWHSVCVCIWIALVMVNERSERERRQMDCPEGQETERGG